MYSPSPNHLSAPQPAEAWKSSTFSELLQIVARYRWLIAVTFLATVFSTSIWLFVRYDVYETTAKVMVRFARDSFSPRSELSSSVSRMIPAPKPDLPTEIDMIGSYSIISMVVDRLHLDQPGPPKPPPTRLMPRLRFELRRASDFVRDVSDEIQYALAFKERLATRDKAIVEISESLSVETTKDSSVFSIKLKTKFKEGASVILNTLVDAYAEQRMNVEMDPGRLKFLEQQSTDQHERLRGQERQLQDLRARAGIHIGLPEEIDLANRRVLEAENQLRATQSLLASLQAKERTLKAQLDEQHPTRVVSEITQRNALLDTLSEQRSNLILDRQKLLGKFGDDHAAIKDIDLQIAQAGKLIASTKETVRQSETKSLNQNFASLEQALLESRQSIQAALAQLQEQEESLNELKQIRGRLLEAEFEYRRLTRQISINEESYRLQRRSSDEFKAAEAMSYNGITQIAVIDRAVDPIVPKGLRKIYILGASIGVGLLLALGLAFVLNEINGTVFSVSTLATKLGLAPIAVLPYSVALQKSLPPEENWQRQVATLASELDRLNRTANMKSFAFGAVHAGAGVSAIVSEIASQLAAARGEPVAVLRLVAERALAGPVTLPIPSAAPGELLCQVQYPVRDAMTGPQLASELSQTLTNSSFKVHLIDIDSSLPDHLRLSASSVSSACFLVVELEQTQCSILRAWLARLDVLETKPAGIVLNKQRSAWNLPL